MKKQLMNQVTNSIFDVMETMFFLTLEEPDEEQGSADMEVQGLKTSAITFSGDFSGTIFLGIPVSLLRAMTESFMGQDIETLTPEHVDGTLKEALNMIAGSALTRVDNTAYMGLGIPEIVPNPKPDDVDETVLLHSAEDVMIAHVKLN
ncbi:MAG: chemotaxis protein CheX [Desulfobacterales bacterium]|nr:chemotaxis protein CheX [Desulfobacterales bacterium]